MSEQLDFLPSLPRPGRRRFPLEPIVREAEVERVGRWTYRWTAKRAWGAGPCLPWMLFNPSLADGKRDDLTMRRMIGFSFRWGYGSLIVFNFYPVVSPDPIAVEAWRWTWDHEAYEAEGMRPWAMDKSTWSAFHHNLGIVEQHIRVGGKRVAAWGSGVPAADLAQLLHGVRLRVTDEEHGDLRLPIVEWHCLGVNADGSPRHPLARGRNWVPDDVQLVPWTPPAGLGPAPGDS